MHLKSLAAVAAFSLIASPVAAAQSAAPLSLAQSQRAGEAVGDASRLEGTTAWVLAAIALGLIVWGIIELTGNDDDAPASP